MDIKSTCSVLLAKPPSAWLIWDGGEPTRLDNIWRGRPAGMQAGLAGREASNKPPHPRGIDYTALRMRADGVGGMLGRERERGKKENMPVFAAVHATVTATAASSASKQHGTCAAQCSNASSSRAGRE